MNVLAAQPEAGQSTGQPQIVALPAPKKEPAVSTTRFTVKEFTNASGSKSWRVDGYKRDGTRIRKNYADEDEANNKRLELELEFRRGETVSAIRATRLTETQVAIAEAAFLRLGPGNDAEMSLAIEHWLTHGRQRAVVKTVRLDDAFEEFKTWLNNQPEAEYSHDTKKNLRNRVNVFVNSVPNMEVSAVTPDTVADFLRNRNVSRQTKTNDRLALSKFFGWCREEKKWTAGNPARKENKTRRPARPEPKVLSVEECERLMRGAEKFKRGRLVPYFAVCLFGGLRPTEAARMDWARVNLADGELTISSRNKTKRGRTIELSATLAAWMKAYKGKPFKPSNFRKDFDAIRRKAGFGSGDGLKPWVGDYMRHTGISHYFRKTGSYGLTAEWAGNSEQVIKNHYQGRVSTADTKKFYSITPTKKGPRK